MALPNLSHSMYVAALRHIQSIHEPADRRNPDTAVRYLLPMRRRLRTALMGRSTLASMRQEPFYYYLVARTKHYDQVIREAVADGIQRIISVGCGSDTRAYRFKDLLRQQGIQVLECDQAEAIHEKQRLTKGWRGLQHVEYLPIDLNDGVWPALEKWIGPSKPKALVFMEGVSPYINDVAFGRFLQFLADRLKTGSHIAYDFKVSGIKDDFGRVGRTERPFRLPGIWEEVRSFHASHGLKLERMELSAALCTRAIPDLQHSGNPLFEEDGLVRLRVVRA